MQVQQYRGLVLKKDKVIVILNKAFVRCVTTPYLCKHTVSLTNRTAGYSSTMQLLSNGEAGYDEAVAFLEDMTQLESWMPRAEVNEVLQTILVGTAFTVSFMIFNYLSNYYLHFVFQNVVETTIASIYNTKVPMLAVQVYFHDSYSFYI